MCSTCRDAKNQTVFTPPIGDEHHFLPANYTLEDYLSISLDLTGTNVFTTQAVNTQAPAMNFEYPSGRIVIATIYSLGLSPLTVKSIMENAKPWEFTQNSTESAIVAYSCDLYWCLQAYNATTMNGVFSSSLVDTWDQMNETMPSDFSVSTFMPGQGMQPTLSFMGIPSDFNVANASEHVLDFESVTALQNALPFAIAGVVGYDSNSYPTFSLDSDNKGSTTDQAITQALWLASNTTDTMSAKAANISAAYSAYMRSAITAPADSHYAPTTSTLAIFVVVRWPWLTYPLVLLVAGYALLLATLLQTHDRRILQWKNKRLPLLLANAEDVVRDAAVGGSDQPRGLSQRAGAIRVQMEFDGHDRLAVRRVGGTSRRPSLEEGESGAQLLHAEPKQN